ncbi:hypothetical protein J6590_040891 [Homalodisca vitripennis]|nr:hypothetical protein J6590_040891 [Homalodisca vitripennis]
MPQIYNGSDTPRCDGVSTATAVRALEKYYTIQLSVRGVMVCQQLQRCAPWRNTTLYNCQSEV